MLSIGLRKELGGALLAVGGACCLCKGLTAKQTLNTIFTLHLFHKSKNIHISFS